MNLGKYFSLILLALAAPSLTFASNSAAVFSLPTFLNIELPSSGIKDANNFDRAIVADYQLQIRDPKNQNTELRENVKRQFDVTDAQLQAIQPFFPVRGKIVLNAEDIRRAQTEFEFELDDLNKFPSFYTRFEAFAQVRRFDATIGIESNVMLDALASDLVKAIEEAGVKSHSVRKLVESTALELNPNDRARFLTSFIKAEMIKMVVARNLQTNVLRAEAGQIAAVLLKPLLIGNSEASKFMFDEFADMRMTREVEYFDPLKVLVEPMTSYARETHQMIALQALTDRTIEQFRSTGYLNDFPYTYDTAERMKIYIERYALDMSLRDSAAHRSSIAVENIKNVLRSGHKNIEDIARRDQLMAEILKYVLPNDLPAVANSILLRTGPGEVVSLGFIRPLVRRLGELTNESLDPIFAAVSSDTRQPASFQQIDFLLELVASRTEVSDLMRSVLRIKMKRKIVAGVFLGTSAEVHHVSRELERYRALVTRAEFIEFLEESAQGAADLVQNETVFMGDVTPWRQAVDGRLQKSALFTLLGRYINATGGDVTPAPVSCNRLLYEDVEDLITH